MFFKEEKIHGHGSIIQSVRSYLEEEIQSYRDQGVLGTHVFKEVGGFDDVLPVLGCGEAGMNSLILKAIQPEHKGPMELSKSK